MKLYNSLTKQKEEFVPIKEGEVKMYVCGPTVYNYFHIGNARPFMMFDAFRKYLEYRGYKVKYVQNFTDVNDKIMRKAHEEGVDALEVSERFIGEYFKDADALGVNRATVHPKVSETIQDIIKFIDILIKKGKAYEVDGDVYFDTSTFEGYGKLSGQSIEDLKAGARVEVSDKKKNPVDFVLWKKKNEFDQYWESPWGQGYPGWHIECSVMIRKHLGDSIDIHAGGQDLIFPHHENEIAQSESFTGKPFAKYWMHNGYINIDNQKMSKSLNNFFTTRDVLKQYDPEVIRFFMLSAHYRSPVNFSRELIEAASNGLDRLYKGKENLEHLIKNNTNEAFSEDDAVLIDNLKDYREKFIKVMDDDFNTADGLAVIFELVKDSNINSKADTSKKVLEARRALLLELTDIVGLLTKVDESLSQEVEALIEERKNARANKDWTKADEIRDRLNELGIILEDTPQGVKWSVKK